MSVSKRLFLNKTQLVNYLCPVHLAFNSNLFVEPKWPYILYICLGLYREQLPYCLINAF